MVARIVGMDVISNKESVTGVEWMVGAVEKITKLEMDVMVLLGELASIVAYLNQVCKISSEDFFFQRCRLKISSSFNRAKMSPTTSGYPVISPNWTFCGPGH
jgi:hypothetical protein